MGKKTISLSEPKLFGNELQYIVKSLNDNQLATGQYIEKFENNVKKYLNSKYSLACINGTAALHIALKVLGIKKNNEVIAPTLTFISTINSIIYNRSFPVFMDCDKYFNIDQLKVIKFINNNTYFKNGKTYNKKTKRRVFALIITHVWGNAVLIDELAILCKQRNIKIVEDAAESLGTKYIKGKFKNKFTGTIGDIGCISFNGNKIITSAGGGMILTDKKSYYEKAKLFINQYKSDNLYFKHNDIGYNYRISNLQSAVGFGQFQNIKKILKLKKNIHNYYIKNINFIKGLEIIKTPDYSINNNWMNMLLLKDYKLTRDKLINIFKNNNIEVRPVWYLNHKQKMFKQYQNYQIKNSEYLIKNTICLPSSTNLSLKNLNRIIKILRENA